jgi:hypothetical protein
MIHEDRNVATFLYLRNRQMNFKQPMMNPTIIMMECLLKEIIYAEAAITFNKVCLTVDLRPNHNNRKNLVSNSIHFVLLNNYQN